MRTVTATRSSIGLTSVAIRVMARCIRGKSQQRIDGAPNGVLVRLVDTLDFDFLHRDTSAVDTQADTSERARRCPMNSKNQITPLHGRAAQCRRQLGWAR